MEKSDFSEPSETLSSSDFHGFSAQQIYSVLSKQLNGIRPWSTTDLKVLDLIRSERCGALGTTAAWPDRVASLRAPEYLAAKTETLAALVNGGDVLAYNYLQVADFNRQVKPGSLVRYYKTGFDSAEGYAVIRTLSPAFMVSPYDSSPPMVTLEAIGRVFLCHVEVEPVGSTVGAKIKSIASGFIGRLLQSAR